MHTHYNGAEIFAFDDVYLYRTDNRLRDVIDYLKGDSFVCGPGRKAATHGRIPVMGFDLSMTIDSDRSTGTRRFAQEEEVQDALHGIIGAIQNSIYDGAIIVDIGPHPPRNHHEAHERACEFCVQGRLLEDASSSSQIKSDLKEQRDEIFRTIHGSSGRIFIPNGEEFPSNIFVTAMSSFYEGDPEGRKHPRYAPHFCMVLVAHRVFGTVTQSMSESIMQRATKSAKPYKNASLYPIPEN